ncbi:MAG: RHS repeat-associated core domain-containing protein [Bacteroidales bacterium]|nr:RHS repeat-associated core domain-containing protein [Bacteroidales bacterium]
MKNHFLFLLVACVSISGYAQAPDFLPQVFSPDAAELGKYGKVPVNYFNGLPNVTIPLTEVHAKNYTLPVYLSYHASGNKPDQHPGWVGQGWSLHAGGCINRIIRGKKDEMIYKEFDDEMPLHDSFSGNPGYMYHASEVQSTNWNHSELLKSIAPGRYNGVQKYYNYYYYDFEPDEFQINIDDISASFYIVGDGKVKIVSKSDTDFTVRWRMNDHARFYNGGRAIDYKFSRQYATVYDTFYEFIVTAKDGTEYYFGGDEDAIEYSIHNTMTEYMSGNEYEWQLRATANSWMLTKIARPDGEIIYFNYKREGVPIVMVDSHSIREETVGLPTERCYNTYGNTVGGKKVYGQGDMNISFYFLLPSYLESITCEIGKDEVLFKTCKSVQLDYEYTKDMFNKRTGQYGSYDNGLYDYMSQYNHYEQLDSLKFNHGEVHFDYTSNPKTRLKLNSVEIVAKNCEPKVYSMTYDSTPLPNYYSRKTDLWGYYNYPDINPLREQMKEMEQFDEFSQLNELTHYEANLPLLKAEMLTKITYPTGGWTSFEYEPHDYSYHICQFPFVAAPLAGTAGGLRIKKISDYSFENKVEERLFTYTDPISGRSSGVSSGRPIYSVKGEIPLDIFLTSYEAALLFDGLLHYSFFSENMLNQLSDTDGCHVTYSCVTETIPGIEKTEYEYSNHDTFHSVGMRNCMDRSPIIVEETFKKNVSFSSMALCRGLLLSKTKTSMTGKEVLRESYTYAQDTTDFIYSVYKYCSDWFTPIDDRSKFIYSGAVSKIYTFFPKLTSKSVSISSDDQGVSYYEKTDYEYDSHRQVVRTVRSCNGNQEETRMTYSGDMPDDQSVYGQMQAAGIFNRPIENTTLRDGKVVSSSLITYRKSGGQFVKDRYYEARLDAPRSSWQKYEGTFTGVQQAVYGAPKLTLDRYDSYGNILEATEEGGQSHRYFWDPAGLHPEVSYMTRDLSGVRTARVEDVASQKVDLSGIKEYTFEFDAERAGDFSFYLRVKKPMPSRMRGILDGKEVFNYELPEDIEELARTMIDNHFGQNIYKVAVEAGHHQFKFIQTGTYQGNSIPGSSIRDNWMTSPSRDSWITYPIYRVEETTGNADTWYYSFESEGNRQKGFNSKKSWQGNKTFTQAIPSDIPYTIDWMELGSDGKWTCKSAAFSGSKTLGGSAEAIDNVRIYPSGAAVTSWTWTDSGDLSSVTDSKGLAESYEYDGMGRLVAVRDADGNKRTSYEYWSDYDPAADEYNHIVVVGYNDESEHGWRCTDRFFDGLGRPWQTVRMCAGGIDADTQDSNLFGRTDYDAAGRPYRSWLPFRSNYVVPHPSVRPSEPLYSDSKPFSLVEYDGLDRPRAEYGPGAKWHAYAKAVRYGYYSNGTSQLLSCQTYSVTRQSMNDVRVSRGGLVAPGSLSVKSVTDEDGLTILTFTDMYGRTLLERRHPASGEDLDTYYVYDGLGRLSAVIPPALSKLDLSTANVDKYAYLYSYDANGNCIAKKLPGCYWTYYVYDKGNRLVFSQSAEQRREGKWMFSFSDILGRSCVTGYCGGSLSSLRQAVSGQNVVASRQGNTSGPYMGYDVSDITLTDPVILSVSYYDDYGFIDSQVPSGLRAKMRYLADFSLAKWGHVNGLLTGSAERILGEEVTNDFRWSTCYYDRKGNPIQTHVTRADGGVDIATTEFTFTGKPERTVIHHAFGAQNAMDEYYAYTYDNWERPLTVKHRLGEDAEWTVVSDLKYDGLGRLTSDNRNGNAKLKTSYTYNVRSWTKNITGPGLTEDLFYEDKGQWGGNIAEIAWTSETDSFRDVYGYDGLSRLSSSTRCRTSDTNHKYFNDYSYDSHGNVVRSTFRDEIQLGSGLFDGLFTTKEFTHDGNRLVSGRIQTGEYDRTIQSPTSVETCQTAYTYDRDGRLAKSEDNGMTEVRYNVVGYPSYVRTADNGYVQNKYTAGGARLESRRMSADGKVTAMAYEGNEVIENGKLRMLMFDGGYVDFSGGEPRYCWYTKDHLGSVRAVADAEERVFANYDYGPYGEDFVAERIVGEDQVLNGAASGSSLTYQPDGGTTVLDGLTPSAEYHLKPGVTLPGTTPAVTYTANESPDWQPYKFSGKESLTRVGLELYDFGARMYSPSNMRWMTMDPLAEKYYHISPYAYCSGDPINRIDPDGCTDYFNQYGVWLYNDGVDDGRILITNEESIQEAMEICGGMDSGEDFFASLESMSLSFSSAVRNGIMDKDNAIKVYDYYNQTGLPIEESDLTKGAGFNFEDPNNVKLVVNIERGAKPYKTEDGNFEYLNDNSYNIINKLNGHEGDGHYKKWQEAGGDKKQFRQIDTEENAINAQMNHPSWSKTTKAFKENTRNYLKRVKK